MRLVTPAAIETVAWEGELVAPRTTRGGSADRPVATIGQPEIWPAAEALDVKVGQKWAAPLGDAEYWLVRLACTLRQPPGRSAIVEATQTLHLRSRDRVAGDRDVYAFDLYPERLGVENKAQFDVSLGPELKFADGAGITVGEVGATIEYRKVFPVIQAYGTGEPSPSWVFKPHAAHPLDGCQCVYAVVAARSNAGGARATITLTATVDTELFGRVRLGLPEEAHAHVSFVIP
ncbi:MAG: hypothetical protein KKA73_24310 [Chloroflexi bacterium]|nr:hypothetical protein [Chloroflexota bacterium]MBU1750817.1 hypothetical protein [Chloroflexota bacterium]MBU1880296.1 hypothetical protein [Chloroflexota bacterium]